MTLEASPTSAARRETLDDILVVDADVHVHESPAALAPYCEMPWRKSLEALANVPERYLDIPGFSPGAGGLSAPFPGGHDSRRMVHNAAQMREELTKLSVDLAILFPDHLLKLPVLPQKEYAAALARAYNAWLVDQWTTRQPGLLGCLVVPPQDPEAGAREIDKYGKEPGIVGVYLGLAGVDPLWGNRKYDPIYQAAQDNDLPVLLHSVQVIHPVFPWQIQGYDTEMARHTVAHPFAIMANLVDMITTGVPVRFPRLRIAFIEAGVSWVPFIMNRLDKEYIERRREVPFLEHRPSHYIRNFYFATQPVEEPENPADLVTLINLYGGEETTMFASDWPHHDFDHPRKVFQLPLSPAARRKIMGENALRFFKIDAQGKRLNL
ncbi:MAG TPA: amidohydrolase family protein [Caldilineaceae bacterium]|nr:amidohydrolase family protein [Caldilineaceae bacterium]